MLINFLKGGKTLPTPFVVGIKAMFPIKQHSGANSVSCYKPSWPDGNMACCLTSLHSQKLKKLCKVKESMTKTIKYGSHPARINMENWNSGYWSKIIWKPCLYDDKSIMLDQYYCISIELAYSIWQVQNPYHCSAIMQCNLLLEMCCFYLQSIFYLL